MSGDDEREGKPVFGQNERRKVVDILWKRLIASDDPPRYGKAFGINRAKTLIDASRLWPPTPSCWARARSCIREACLSGYRYRQVGFLPRIGIFDAPPADRSTCRQELPPHSVEKRCGRFVSISLRGEGWEIVFLDNPDASSLREPRQNGLWMDVYQCRRRQNRLSTNSWTLDPTEIAIRLTLFNCVFGMNARVYLFNYFKLIERTYKSLPFLQILSNYKYCLGLFAIIMTASIPPFDELWFRVQCK